MKEMRTKRKLARPQREEVISSLYEKIEDKEIWIPYLEVEQYAFSKTTKIVNAFHKQFSDLSVKFEEENTKKKR